ncbi:hypothetical protein FUT63_14025 [Extensimonas vulgaris]|jgi:hypothetical protein|nr:hypothetical protein FUT63_14025 [Extensimonas vulgaris]
MGQAEVMLSAKEVGRLVAINRVLEGRSTQALAARAVRPESAAAQALQRQAARMRHGNTFMRLPSPVFERNQKPC